MLRLRCLRITCILFNSMAFVVGGVGTNLSLFVLECIRFLFHVLCVGVFLSRCSDITCHFFPPNPFYIWSSFLRMNKCQQALLTYSMKHIHSQMEIAFK